MVINWGKPKLEIKKLVGSSAWTELKTPKEDTTKLETQKGDKIEAKEEGGGTVDTKYKKGAAFIEFQLFQRNGEDKPIDDDDGVIIDNYSIRLTPEDETLKGYIIDKASVSIVENWTSADGTLWTYTFDALVPDDNTKMVKPYEVG
jgi:hypothetical protein